MFVKTSFASVFISCAICLSSSANAADRPNILLVMVDDMGWTDLGAYGGEIETPNLDALAQQGMLFTDFHASVSCSPTRSMLLSGNGSNPFYSTDYPGAAAPEFVDLFDHNLERLGHPGSNYAYGPGFASGSSGPLDRFKMTVGEGGIRVPLIMAGPGILAGQTTDAFTYVWDILPTLLDMTDIEYPATYDGHAVEAMRGRSMVPLLNGTAQAVYGPDDFVGGEMGEGKWMRQGSFKAVQVPPPYGDGEWHLFNVDEDPGESSDLAGEMPELLSTLVVAWDAYAAEVGVIPAEM